ncbi:MAG: RagB/SusD family nutrient uptake outer membrane protein [Pedobacter sp.]
MKTIFQRSIVLILLVVSITACKKSFLQNDNPNDIAETLFYQNEKDALFGLYGIYDAYQSPKLFGFKYAMFDGAADNAMNTQNLDDFGDIEKGNNSPVSEPVNDIFTQFYTVINRANYVIKRTTEIDKASISESSRNRIIAEASFLRDFAYFELSNIYRDVPLYLEPNGASSTGKSSSKKAEILAFLKQDLISKIPNLPTTIPAAEYGRTGRGGAVALLGKIYLWEKDYSNAAVTFAQLMTGPYNFTLYSDYAGLFTSNSAAEFSSENIFQINFASDGVDNGSTFAEVVNTSQAPRLPRSSFVPLASLVDSYLCTDGKPIIASTLYGSKSPLYNATGTSRFMNRDPRLRATVFTAADVTASGQKIWSFANTTSFAVRKYIEVSTNQYAANPQNFYIIRYADVLLMYAESKNEELGLPDASVYNAVNLVRRRVKMPDYPAGLTKEQMRLMIRDERRWEFGFEYQRFFDLKRWGTLATEIAALPATAKKNFVNPRDYVWPIPQGELDNNANIAQAEEWR